MNWNRSSLISEISPFDWAGSQLSQLDEYKRYYGLNFPQAESHQVGFIESSGYQVLVHQYLAEEAKGTAILVHGYYDHVGLYSSLIEFCLNQQLNVVAFDLPGHGLSSGDPAAIDDFQVYDAVFADVLSYVQANMTGNICAFGQSTGGAILINHLLKNKYTADNAPFKKVTLLAPLVRPNAFKMAKYLHPIVSKFTKNLKRGHVNSSTDKAFLDFVENQDPLQAENLSVQWIGAMVKWVKYIEAQPASDYPLMIVQGDHDQTVDWQHNLNVLESKFPNQELLIIPDGRHHLVNDGLEKRQLMYQKISGYLSK